MSDAIGDSTVLVLGRDEAGRARPAGLIATGVPAAPCVNGRIRNGCYLATRWSDRPEMTWDVRT